MKNNPIRLIDPDGMYAIDLMRKRSESSEADISDIAQQQAANTQTDSDTTKTKGTAASTKEKPKKMEHTGPFVIKGGKKVYINELDKVYILMAVHRSGLQ